MRILSITAGAAGMYCGSCSRDNALAAELIARGHDITLAPVYTPTRTDEPNLSRHHILFGGISVYLEQYHPLFRHTPKFLDRLWDSPNVIRAFTGHGVSHDPHLLGAMTISMLRGEQGPFHKEFVKLLDWLRTEPRPEIVNLPNSLLISLAEPLRRALGCPVVCTLQGEELFIDGLDEPYRTQTIELIREQVRHVDRFIAVTEFCARLMKQYLAIPEELIRVVPLGINLDGYESRESRGADTAPFRIGYFARVAPEKGLKELAEAYIRFRRRSGTEGARLEAAGYLDPGQRDYLAGVQRLMKREGLQEEFAYHGEMDRAGKLAFLRSLDVFCVPPPVAESKGIFLLEAMASGVPVVEPRSGAFTEIVEKTGGGLLVEPGNPEALAAAIDELFRDGSKLDGLGRRAYDGVQASYSIANSAARLMETYEEVVRSREVAGSHAG